LKHLSFERYKSFSGGLAYRFDPFLYELSAQNSTAEPEVGNTPVIDPSEIDTIVVPARSDGFQEVFIGENRWYAIRIHSSMKPKIRYIGVYQVAPVSAITHMAEVADIEPWKDTEKYCVNFKRTRSKSKDRANPPRLWWQGGRTSKHSLHVLRPIAKSQIFRRCFLATASLRSRSDLPNFSL
jgi:hypothetical protein